MAAPAMAVMAVHRTDTACPAKQVVDSVHRRTVVRTPLEVLLVAAEVPVHSALAARQIEAVAGVVAIGVVVAVELQLEVVVVRVGWTATPLRASLTVLVRAAPALSYLGLLIRQQYHLHRRL